MCRYFLAKYRKSADLCDQNLRILQMCTRLPLAAGIEALRCIANGLLLHEVGRERWLALGGGPEHVRRLGVSQQASFKH